MIPEGIYKARAEREFVSFGKSSNQNEQVSVPFRITSDCPERGQSILWIRVFTAEQKTVDITCDGLEAAGWDGEDLRALAGLGGVECEIVVKHEVYDGKTRPKIKFVNRLGRSPFKVELTPNGLDSLADRVARMRGRGAPRREDPPPTGDWDGTGPDPTDDVPF